MQMKDDLWNILWEPLGFPDPDKTTEVISHLEQYIIAKQKCAFEARSETKKCYTPSGKLWGLKLKYETFEDFIKDVNNEI